MPSITISTQVAAPAESAWAVLADFADVAWIPIAGKVEVEGSGPGMRRKIHGSGDTPVVETLKWIRPDQRRLAYEITDNPLPVRRFEAVAFVDAVDAGERCVVGWNVDYDPAGDDADAREAISAVYGMMTGWLEQAASTRPTRRSV